MSNNTPVINTSPKAQFELAMAVREMETLAKVLSDCDKPFYACELLRIKGVFEQHLVTPELAQKHG